MYNIYLDDQLIGISQLEKADAPMGVVSGVIQPVDKPITYDRIKRYCLKNNIKLNVDYPDDKVLSTASIASIKVLNKAGMKIVDVGNELNIMDGEPAEITLYGIAYPFYAVEFPHHIEQYEMSFKS